MSLWGGGIVIRTTTLSYKLISFPIMLSLYSIHFVNLCARHWHFSQAIGYVWCKPISIQNFPLTPRSVSNSHRWHCCLFCLPRPVGCHFLTLCTLYSHSHHASPDSSSHSGSHHSACLQYSLAKMSCSHGFKLPAVAIWHCSFSLSHAMPSLVLTSTGNLGNLLRSLHFRGTV